MEDRKKSHIDLAGSSQTDKSKLDLRFQYEPMLSAHPDIPGVEFTFLNKKFKIPVWVSSMTGGTSLAREINTNLALACKEFGMGMGLGSCRILLDSNEHLPDFDLRSIIGDDRALFANIGITQLEKLSQAHKLQKLHDLVARLHADGLVIHVNPLQEWIQPEGDKLKYAPIETITRVLDEMPYQVIVKEVGQGIGKESLRQLLNLPIDAVEFAAYGGTNFSALELQRRNPEERPAFEPFVNIGVDAWMMLDIVNEIVKEQKDILCRQVIISGGIRNYLDGYYAISRSKLPAIYGQASSLIVYAKESYDALHRFLEGQIDGLNMAKAYLKIRE